MKTLTNEEINHIRDSVDIVDIVSSYISLTKKGKNYFGVCPFHEDSDPSLSVSPDKQIFSCFSCHTAGNVFTFIMEYEHISFIEAVIKVAGIAGITVDVKVNQKQEYRHSIYDIYDISQKFYVNNLYTTIGKPAKEYLIKRGITEELMKEFEVGLALRSTDSLTKLLQKKEFVSKDLEDSGILVKDEQGFHDFFYDRVLFPLHDVSNRVIGYSGRVYYETDSPKYINSREHPLFKKGEFVYNYYRAKEECRKTNTVIIMEGFMDVIRAYSIGVKNTVATMGTAFTKQHVGLIKRLAGTVIICYDGDNAGNKATLACANELIASGILPKIVRLEENLDPDEYILKYGKEKFVEKLENPMSVMDFKLNFFKQKVDLTSSVDKANYVTKILEEVNKINDDILREVTLKKLSSETDLELDFLKEKLKPVLKQEIFKPVMIKTDKYEQAQLALLFYMMKSGEVIKIVGNQTLYFPKKEYRLLYGEIKYFYEQNDYINEADFISTLNSMYMKTIGLVESNHFKEEYTNEVIFDYIRAIQEKNFEDQCERLNKKLKEETDIDKQIEIANKIVELKRRQEKDV